MTDLHPLKAAGRAAAAETLAAAFDADPLFVWAIPDAARRARWLRAFMRSSLWLAWRDGRTWAAPPTNGERPGAVLSAVPPGRKTSRSRQVGFALRQLPQVLLGRPAPSRLRHLVRLGWRLEDHHPHAPHWHFFQLGVDPERQGQGLGRTIMEHAVALADADAVPAYLETSNPVNLPFYRHFGFDLVDTIALGGAPPVWTMLRPRGA